VRREGFGLRDFGRHVEPPVERGHQLVGPEAIGDGEDLKI